MKKYISIIVVFTLVISACSSSQKRVGSVDNIVDINVSNSEELDFRKYFDAVRYVALETTKDVLIGEVTKIYLTNDHIIIFDQKSMDIFLFGIDGKFIRKIGKKGEGPDEYIFLNDIQFDKERMLVFAHERFRNSIYTYDLYGNYGDEIYAYGSNGEDCANSYFVDTYSMTYPSEDRAKIWENIMSDEKYVYWEKTPHLTAKLNYYAECIRQNFDSTGWNDVRWEKYMNK